jgi:hypothetical protein
MSDNKTSSKKLKRSKTLGKARDEDPGSSPEGRSTMSSDTAQPEEHHDPRDGTAVIPPVTDTMLDHAAHEAAALADAVAHGAIAARVAAEPPAAAGSETATGVPEAGGTAGTGAAPSDEAPGEAPQDPARTPAGDASGDAAPPPPAGEADPVSHYGARVLDMMRANVASTTAHLAALVQAKSVPDALSLNAEHLRRQVETMVGQGRELATLAQRIALGALQPSKDSKDR